MKQQTRQKAFTLSALLGFALAGVATANPIIEVVPDTIDTDTTWDSDTDGDGVVDKIYFMSEAAFVGDFFDGSTRPTLTIAPGTVIAAVGANTGNSGLDVGALVIAQTGAINAEGTADNPIIFTSAAEAEFLYGVDVDGDSVVNSTKPDPIGGDADGSDGGAWGGVIILGNAPINYYNTPTNNLNSNTVEGFAKNLAGDDILYGGDDPADNSGIFRYVSIRFGGFEFATDEEINGLTMAGVGSGTTIDHVEVVANTDDGFEWFGGTVNTSHLFALYCQDESFDFDEGHQGTHQFFFAVQSNLSDNGTEADGGNRTGTGVKDGEPLTNTKIYNATYVGAPGSADAFRLKDNFAGQFHNSIFASTGDDLMRIDDNATIGQVGVNLLFTNNLWGTPGGDQTNNDPTSADAGVVARAQAEADVLAQTGNVLDAEIQFTEIARNAAGEVSVIDPRPVLGSSAWGTALTAGAPEAVDYRGAFGRGNWAAGWTYAEENGILTETPAPVVTIEVVPDTIDTDTTWDSDTDGDGVVDKIYFMSEAAFVGDFFDGSTRPTLTIAPGTVIAAVGANTGNSGLDVGALVIAQTGAINAEGTADNPIIFTSAAEAEFLYGVDVDGDSVVNSTKPDPIGGDADGSDGGAWGGVIILGNAPINYYNTPTNNLNSNTVEGFAKNLAGDDILYGGDDPADNSGIFRYVSIRFGGFEFATDEEINGLTMAGVGSGTTIDHVEVVANTDDGFEWFGGTVNTSHLFALYCQDESFDFDEGHQGTHQFFFAVQSNLSDNGTEADGGNRTGTGVKDGEPLTNTKIYNATYVGAPGSADAFRLKDNFAGQFHNSIFASTGDDLMRIDDNATIGQVGVNLLFTNNLWGTPGGDQTNNDPTSADAGVVARAQAEADVLAQTGNVLDAEIQFTEIARNAAGEVSVIDPRPVLGSSAWGTALTAGAPEAVDYRGAFGRGNWAAGWTYADLNGIVNGPMLVERGVVELTSSSFDGTTFTINFVAEPGASYKVTQSSTLNGAFTDVDGAVLLDAPAAASISFAPPAAPKLFFRIEKAEE